MILGQDSSGNAPTAQNPVPFQPPAAARSGFVPSRPRPGFMSTNFWPFSKVLNPMRAFPAYHPHHGPNVGPHGFPDSSPATAAAPSASVATQAPVPAITATTPTAPGGTRGSVFGGSGFGSNGGVRHMHVDPYRVMRGGFIPGVDPSGANIRAGYENTLARVNRSMPFQTQPLPPPPPPPPPPMPAAAATHGFGYPMMHHRRRHWWQPRQEMSYEAPVQTGGCEWVGPRVDGISVKICDGRVVSYRDAQGNVTTPGDFQGPGRQGWFMRNFGWRRRRRHHPGAVPVFAPNAPASAYPYRV